MILQTKNKTVFVGMSGGVDSAVAAGLMKEAGYNVVGVTMCFNISHPNSKRASCCGVEGIEDAKRAAQVLGIPHYVFNFAEDINEHIIDNFTHEYLNGRTPNPCVQCNKHLKFGSLFEKVRALGADYLATGHYAKIEYNESRGHFELKKGEDKYKDQSYFLYSMNKDTLPYVLFPLGNMTKSQVRELARKFGLPNAEKPGSQDICFIPDTGYQKFIEERLGKEVMVPGPFKDEDGNVVGEHKGIAYYTIGQRDRLGLALGRPVYVYKINKEANTIYVGNEQKLHSKGLFAGEVNFVSTEPPIEEIQVKVKIRYNHAEVNASLSRLDEAKVKVEFEQPQRSVTPGQSAVFYNHDVVIGGGIIERAITEEIDVLQKIS